MFREFYGQFLNPGDLCFDIGANLGNRVRGFRALECRVVALEPQQRCFQSLTREFGSDPDVTLIRKAVGATPGELELHVSPHHVLSSFSKTFIDKTSESGRFSGVKWDQRQVCEVTTMDALIASHGMPQFVKIDVEGFESQVLAGLSTAVPALSLEWVPELPANAAESVMRLAKLGNYEFNVSFGEEMKFSRQQWRTTDSILNLIEELKDETSLFGDIYARLKP